MVTWDSVPNYYNGDPQTFQVIIHRAGDIVFQYKDISFSTYTKTAVGIQSFSTSGKTLPVIHFYPNYNTSFVWDFPEDSPHADEVNAFYHINLFRDYLTNYLRGGFDNFEEVPVEVYAPQGALEGTYYSPDEEKIYLSANPDDIFIKNSARCGDAIYHEYTHFVSIHPPPSHILAQNF